MTNISLKVEERLISSGGKVKKLRAEGYVPGIVYGKSIEPKSIKVKASDLRSLLSKYGKSAMITAEFENGEKIPALIKEIQYGVLKNEYLNLDLQQVSMTEKVRTSVPIKIVGREVAEKTGGILVQQLDTVEVECLPQNAPQLIHLDVSKMTIGDSLTASELNLPELVALFTEPDQVVLSITSFKAVEEPEDSETETEDSEDSEDSETETD